MFLSVVIASTVSFGSDPAATKPKLPFALEQLRALISEPLLLKNAVWL